MSGSYNNSNDWREELKRKREEQRQKHMARFSHGGIYAGHGSSHSHLVMGIIVLLVGVLFLLENLGFFYVGDIFRFWPVILIGLGIARILDGRGLHGMLWGLIVGGVGVVLLTNSLGYIPWNLWRLLWPALLILLGVLILARGFDRHGKWTGPQTFVDDTSTISDNVLKEEVVFGGIHRKVTSQDFQGGDATAIFGGIEVDLRGAAITKDVIDIEADAIFGGVELMVPDTWDVVVRGTGILGGYEDKTHPAPLPEGGKHPRLVIRGSAIFGGVTVRN